MRGNSALAAEDIDKILSPAAGLAVNLDQLQKSLDQLQTAYREKGFPNATVSLPQQLLFPDGTITIEVSEGLSQTQIAARLAEAEAVETNIVAKSADRTFEVRHYEVLGNTLLRQEIIGPSFQQRRGFRRRLNKSSRRWAGCNWLIASAASPAGPRPAAAATHQRRRKSADHRRRFGRM